MKKKETATDNDQVTTAEKQSRVEGQASGQKPDEYFDKSPLCSVCGKNLRREYEAVQYTLDLPTLQYWKNLSKTEGQKLCVEHFRDLPLSSSSWVNRRKAVASEFLKGVGVSNARKNDTLENFDVTDENQSLFNQVTAWIKEPSSSLALLSRYPGNGKTHLAIACLREYFCQRYDLIKGYPVPPYAFKKEREIYLSIRASYDDHTVTNEKSIIEELCKKEFLVIDDLFSHGQTEFVRRVMLDILDERIDWQCKPTVVTSNLLIEDIEKIDLRIASRLMRGTCIEVKNARTDYRLKGSV